MALHYGKTIYNKTIVSPLVEPWNVSTYLLCCLVASQRCANQQRCLQGKKVCRVDEALWFLFASCKSPALHAGCKRQARLYRFSGGPKLDRIHCVTQQLVVSNDRQSAHSSGHQNKRLQCTRMQSCPNGHRDRHITLVTSQMYNVHDSTADDHFQLPSTRQFVPGRLLKVLQGV